MPIACQASEAEIRCFPRGVKVSGQLHPPGHKRPDASAARAIVFNWVASGRSRCVRSHVCFSHFSPGKRKVRFRPTSGRCVFLPV